MKISMDIRNWFCRAAAVAFVASLASLTNVAGARASEDVGACAPSLEALVKSQDAISLYRDDANQLRAWTAGSGELPATAEAKARGEASFRVRSTNLVLEVKGRRLARFDGKPYVVFDARAKSAAWGPKAVPLSCRLLADRLAPDRAREPSKVASFARRR